MPAEHIVLVPRFVVAVSYVYTLALGNVVIIRGQSAAVKTEIPEVDR